MSTAFLPPSSAAVEQNQLEMGRRLVAEPMATSNAVAPEPRSRGTDWFASMIWIGGLFVLVTLHFLDLMVTFLQS